MTGGKETATNRDLEIRNERGAAAKAVIDPIRIKPSIVRLFI